MIIFSSELKANKLLSLSLFEIFHHSEFAGKGGKLMNHSGWKKLNRANRHFRAYPVRFILIFLLTCGLLFASPEVDSFYDVKKTDFISGLIGEGSIPPDQFENEETISLGKGCSCRYEGQVNRLVY